MRGVWEGSMKMTDFADVLTSPQKEEENKERPFSLFSWSRLLTVGETGASPPYFCQLVKGQLYKLEGTIHT